MAIIFKNKSKCWQGCGATGSPVHCWGWKWKVLATQSSPTLRDPMDCSSPGQSVHGILQARKLEWVSIPFSRGVFLTQEWGWGGYKKVWLSWKPTLWFLKKLNIELLHDPAMPLLAIYRKEWKALTQIHSTFIAALLTRQKMETIQMSINTRIGK